MTTPHPLAEQDPRPAETEGRTSAPDAAAWLRDPVKHAQRPLTQAELWGTEPEWRPTDGEDTAA